MSLLSRVMKSFYGYNIQYTILSAEVGDLWTHWPHLAHLSTEGIGEFEQKFNPLSFHKFSIIISTLSFNYCPNLQYAPKTPFCGFTTYILKFYSLELIWWQLWMPFTLWLSVTNPQYGYIMIWVSQFVGTGQQMPMGESLLVVVDKYFDWYSQLSDYRYHL